MTTRSATVAQPIIEGTRDAVRPNLGRSVQWTGDVILVWFSARPSISRLTLSLTAGLRLLNTPSLELCLGSSGLCDTVSDVIDSLLEALLDRPGSFVSGTTGPTDLGRVRRGNRLPEVRWGLVVSSANMYTSSALATSSMGVVQVFAVSLAEVFDDVVESISPTDRWFRQRSLKQRRTQSISPSIALESSSSATPHR